MDRELDEVVGEENALHNNRQCGKPRQLGHMGRCSFRSWKQPAPLAKQERRESSFLLGRFSTVKPFLIIVPSTPNRFRKTVISRICWPLANSSRNSPSVIIVPWWGYHDQPYYGSSRVQTLEKLVLDGFSNRMISE